MEYKDGRHPLGVVFSDEKEDVIRRDFTVNGLLFDPLQNRIIDYVGGKKDINDKIIRCIGEPVKTLWRRQAKAFKMHSFFPKAWI